MHETFGDGYITVGGIRLYADEDIPLGRNATQCRHEEHNSFQEELANVIRAESITLNASDEPVSSMNQLNTAIDLKVTNGVAAEASLRSAGDSTLTAIIAALAASDIDNDSAVAGANVDDALETLKNDVDDLRAAIVTPSVPLPITVVGGAVWTDTGSWAKYKPFGSTAFSVMLWGEMKGSLSVATSSLIELDVELMGGVWTGKVASYLNGLTFGTIAGTAEAMMMSTPAAAIALRFERLSGSVYPITSAIVIPFSVVGHAQ